MSLFKFIYKFAKDNRAIAAVEFALIVPVILILFLGGFEITRYVLIFQKVSKTTSSMSDLISRSPELYEADIANSFNAVEHLLAPHYAESKTKVIISSIRDDGNGNLVNWQRCGGGTLDVDSELGQQGDYVTLPSGFDLTLNEDTIVAEVFLDYESVVGIDITEAGVLHKYRYTKPRLGSLMTIIDDAGVTGC